MKPLSAVFEKIVRMAFLFLNTNSMTGAARKTIVVALLVALSITAIGQTVYITRSGKKYHEDGCRYLSKSKIETTLAQALEAMYDACSVCGPPTQVINSVKQNSTKAPTRNAVSRQCTGMTKAGARCKRMTLNANGRCYQH